MFENILVVGMHFRGAWAKEYAATLQGGEILRLEREPTNEYDAYAIKVITPGGQHLGYVEGVNASYIAAEMDEDPDQVWVAEVTGTETRKNNIHPVVTVRHLFEDEDLEDIEDEDE